ncbi:hypothetical protein Tco_0802813 [Tanacetum coccineum]|uniref:Uncharacterized protein n=1 Tax=Tanacetum coccineum TaxID=301880 RepID=A0ABQ5A3U1_9ASTR
MSKNLKEHGFVSTIQQRTNHKDLQNCLFACFLSQEEPKKVIHALKDPSWIEAYAGRAFTIQVTKKFQTLWIYNEKRAIVIKVKTASIPIETSKASTKDVNGVEVDVQIYQVNQKVLHLYDVKRIFRYLKGQPKLSLWYPKDSPFDLVAYTNSDYAGASLDRKSTTGGCQFLGCRLISWQCKKQTVVANSITEAEYVAASSCCGQVLWIQNQLLDYGYNFMHTKIFIDNNRKAKKSVKLMMEKLFRMELKLMLLGKKIIVTEASVRRNLQLEDEEDEAVYKELGDSLVRAATTASSLEAEQDSDCQETMGDTIAQTRVLDLEKTKTTQANEIASLKRRVKKLKKKRSSRTHKLKRLYKVGLSARVESSGDEEDLGEDASKQGRRINAIDADEDITLVNIQDDADNEMFDVNVLNGEDVFVAGQNENVVEEVVDVAQVSTAAITVIITTEEITLAQALEALKTSKPKVRKTCESESHHKDNGFNNAVTRGGGTSKQDGQEGERTGDQVESGRGGKGSGRGSHVNNQGNNENQDNNVVNDKTLGNVRIANMNNGRGGCLYKEFLACHPKDYDGKGGVIVYTHWIEKMETVQDMSGCGEN